MRASVSITGCWLADNVCAQFILYYRRVRRLSQPPKLSTLCFIITFTQLEGQHRRACRCWVEVDERRQTQHPPTPTETW